MWLCVDIAVQVDIRSIAGCVGVNRLLVWSRSSFKVVFFLNLEGHKIEKFAFGNVSPESSSQFKNEKIFQKPWGKFFLPSPNIRSSRPKQLFKKIFFWNIMSNSQENICQCLFKLQLYTLSLQEKTPAQVFPINFRKFPRAPLFRTPAGNDSKYLIVDFAPEYCYCHHLLASLRKKLRNL